MTLTDIAAWLGAVSGSIALVWDFYKWLRSGPRLQARVNPHMVEVRYGTTYRFAVIWVSNRGNAKTTISAVAFSYYSTINYLIAHLPVIKRWARLETVILTNTEFLKLPKVVDAGEEWSGAVRIEDGDLFSRARSRGVLVCLVGHSMSERNTKARVRY